MINPIKARQIGFFTFAIAGFVHFLSIMLLADYTFGIKGNPLSMSELRSLNIIFPVFLFVAWKPSRNFATNVLKDDPLIYMNVFWLIYRLINKAIFRTIFLILIYVLALVFWREGAEGFSFDPIDIIEYPFIIIFCVITIYIGNLFPTGVSATVLFLLLQHYKNKYNESNEDTNSFEE